MKTILPILFTLCSISVYGQNINFPDANFKNALIEEGFDLDNDGEISESEALEVGRIVVANKEITSLEGIAYFKNASWLDIKSNKLISLDLREVTKLQNLYMANNEVETLEVAGLQNLATISGANNNMNYLELKDLPRVSNLYIDNNPISTVDLSNLPNLQRINTRGTQIDNLDFSNNPKIFSLTLNSSPIAALDLTGLCALSSINIRNTPITELDATDCVTLKTVLASGSNLELLKIKNTATEETIELNSLTNLKEICVDDDQAQAVTDIITDLGYTNVNINSNCQAPAPLTTYYRDMDQDGYGDESTASTTCIQPSLTVTISGDCDDRDETVYPGAPELCDEIDNNCDGNIDEGLTTTIYYTDRDGDGYGDESTSTEDCSQPNNTVTIAGDCNDNNPNINPDAQEIPNNGIDEDCDGLDLVSSINDLSQDTFSIHPNPASDYINIVTDKKMDFQVEIFNIYGQLVLSHTNEDFIATSSLQNGSYVLIVTDNSRQSRFSERLIISK